MTLLQTSAVYTYIHECISILTFQTANSIVPLLSASNPHPSFPLDSNQELNAHFLLLG